MKIEQKLARIRDAVQVDPCKRGLTPELFGAFPEDFANACRSLAEHPQPRLGVVTGFYIPSAALGETDGPLGAVYLARTLPNLGIQVHLASDPFCRRALASGLDKCGHICDVAVLDLPGEPGRNVGNFWPFGEPTHLLAIERVGPSHTFSSIRAQYSSHTQIGLAAAMAERFRLEVPEADRDRCHTMRGIDITEQMLDAASLFDRSNGADSKIQNPKSRIQNPPPPVTIGIGDGGNEIGMGKVPWDVIRRHIPRGELIACRVATDHLLVAGVSNWGAYALSAGVALLRGFAPPEEWFDLERERSILETMVEQGPLVDGVTGRTTASVDGLEFMEYAAPLSRIAAIVRA
jgi:hypothetical protein